MVVAAFAALVLDLAQEVLVAPAEPLAHPPVDERVVGAGRHGQPVGRQPHVAHELVLPDVRVGVSQDGDEVDGQPARRVDPHHRHHHLDDLKHTTATLVSSWILTFCHPRRVGLV